MRIICLLLFIILFGGQSYGQPCDCLLSFNTLVKKVELNYPGFPDRVTPTTLGSYQILKDSLQREANHSESYQCLKVLSAYTAFFQDTHLSIDIIGTETNQNQIRALFTDWPRLNWTEKQTKVYLAQPGRAPLEGIWEVSGGSYQIAIVSDKGSRTKYIGFILKADSIYWMPGQIKIRLEKKGPELMVIGYLRNHTPLKTFGVLSKNTLTIDGFSNWFKTFPHSNGKEIMLPGFNEPRFDKLNAEANVLTLPSFDYNFKGKIDSLIEANKKAILCTPLLIVDVRNNGGGSVDCFEQLLPFLYTNPMLTRSVSALATNDNIALYDEILVNTNDSSYRKELTGMLERMKANGGKLVKLSTDTIRFDTIYPYPAKVAILMNKQTASAAEILVQRGQQSKKVTTFGQPTKGGLDYTNITDPIPLNCTLFGLIYPTLRSDEVIPGRITKYYPDVPIKESSKWQDFVLSWMKKEKR